MDWSAPCAADYGLRPGQTALRLEDVERSPVRNTEHDPHQAGRGQHRAVARQLTLNRPNGLWWALGLVSIIFPVRLASSRPSAPAAHGRGRMNSRSTPGPGAAASVRQTKGDAPW